MEKYLQDGMKLYHLKDGNIVAPGNKAGSDEDLNNLDRGAEGGRRNKDSKNNLQSLLRRRYQKSRGSARSESNDENPSPVQEPVSFRPPARPMGKTSMPSSRGTQRENRDANGNIVFENNFDFPPQSDPGSQKGHGNLKLKGQGQGQRQSTQKDKGQLDSALSTVINEISSDSRKGARSKQRESGTKVFENNFDDLDPSMEGECQPSTSRSRPASGASKLVNDEAERERQARLQRFRKPRQLPDETQDPFYQMLMKSSENKDADGDEKMERSGQLAAGGASGSSRKAMTQDEEDEQFLLQNFMGSVKKKKKGVNAKPARHYNNMMQNLLGGGGDNENEGNKPVGQHEGDGKAKDPLTEMMEALGGLGKARGGASVGEQGAGGAADDPLSQLLQQLEGVKGRHDDNKGEEGVGGGVGGGADPMAQLLGGLGGGMGGGGGVMMGQERQKKGDPMAQMMAMMGGGRGQRNAGAGQGGMDQMTAMMGGGGQDPMSQMMAALGGGGNAGGQDPMSQMMAALGGGGGNAGGQDPMSQMMAALGGGGGGAGGQDPMSQMMAALGGGGGNAGGQDPMSQMMAALGGGGGGAGGQDPMSQMMAALGGGGGNAGGQDPMSQMMAALGGGGGGAGGQDPMSQMMAALGGGGGGAGNPMSQMMEMMGGGQPPAGAGGQGHGRGQAQDEDIDIENASLNDQIQQLLGYESLKAHNNKSPKSDGMCTIIIIDTSGSMHGDPMTSVGDFISQFLNGLEEVQFEYGLEENVAIISAGREVHVIQHLTTDYSMVRRAVDTIYADGPSPLHLGLMIPLSILQIDQQQGRDYIANSNGHRICPRVILITDGHPTNQEDIPGHSRPANEQESLTLQNICVEMFQTVRERTLCELYAIPVGDANISFLQNLSESTGGCIQLTADAKHMSRVYLHHLVVGNLRVTGYDLTKREVVAKVVQQCMACSDDSDVDSVMKILAQGEPDIQKRDQELRAELQGGRGRGGGAHRGGRGGGQGGVGQMGGRGMPPMVGGGGGMDMLQSMMGGIGGGAQRPQGGPGDIGGRGQQDGRHGDGNMAAMMRSMMGEVGGGGQRQEGMGQGRQNVGRDHDKLLQQLGGGLGEEARQRGAAERLKPILMGGEGQGHPSGIKENQNEVEAEENAGKNDNDAKPLTHEEMMQLLPEGGNEDAEFLTSENPIFNPHTVELLMSEKGSRRFRKGKRGRTEEESRKIRFEKVINAESMGINERNTSSDEEMNEAEAIPRRPDAAEQDINRKLRELLRKKAEKKKSGNAQTSGSQRSQEQSEARQNQGGSNKLGVPNSGFGQGSGGFLKEYPGLGANPRGAPLESTPDHNLPEHISDIKLDKKSERSRSAMPPQSGSSVIYQRPGSTLSQGGATGSQTNTQTQKVTTSSLEGLGLINVDGEDEEEPSAPVRTKQQTNRPAQTVSFSRRWTDQNRDLRELLLQRQQRNARQNRQTSGRHKSKQVDSESDS